MQTPDNTPVVVAIDDLSPNYNSPNHRDRTPAAGTLVAYTTRCRITVPNINNEEVVLDIPRFNMIFVALISPDGTGYRTRVCEPNLAHMSTPAPSGEPWPAYWRRMILNAWNIGTTLMPDDGKRIFPYLSGDYGLQALE